MGYCTNANGAWSTAMGYATIASGLTSTAMGYCSIAGGAGSFVGGAFMQLKIGADNTFVWGHSTSAQPISTANAFLIFPVGTPGKVGVGTVNPEEKMHINRRSDIYGAAILLDSTGVANGRKFYVGSTLSGNVGGAGLFQIYDVTVSLARFNIDALGNVGIGTTSPSYKLHVNGTAYATGAAGALSDGRHKKNINDLSLDALRVVKELRPVTFAWKEPQDNGMEGAQLGFIAQEVEKVLPDAILTQDNEEQTKGLKYSALIPVLTKAIQQLEAENEELKARSKALMSLVCQDHPRAGVCQ
jgi:hypothetical protein